MNAETPIMREIRFALNNTRRVRVVRNMVGFDDRARSKYGLGRGSPDLVGVLRGGRAFAVEVKTAAGRVQPEQDAWMRVFRKWGGFAAVARNVDEALSALARAEAGHDC